MSKTNSNSKKYIKTYLWQGIALVLRFLSLFIVVPFLSSEPKIYGIYSVCISVLIFLNYADLGFLVSSIKYATESYANGNRKEEMKYIGFGTFVLLTFSLIISGIFLYYSFYPQRIVEGLDTAELKRISSSLMLILAIFTPLIVLQRTVTIIFNIRMQGYINKIISIVSSVITIASTFFFFSEGKYYIIEYFLFFQTMNFLSTIVMFYLANRNYNYDIIKLFSEIRFNKEIFNKSKKLAYSSFIAMISWVFFYELDKVAIGRFIGVDKVAIFSISIIFATLFRSIFSIVFNPFNVRANYYVGNNDEVGLKNFIKNILILTAPLTVLPAVGIAVVSESLIISWVGEDYRESIAMARVFALLFCFSFVTYSASAYIVSKEKVKEMYYMSISMPIIYWVGVYLGYQYFDMIAFPIFKFFTILISVGYYILFLMKNLSLPLSFFIKRIFLKLSLPLATLILLLSFFGKFMPLEKSKLNFIIVISTTGFVILLSLLIQYFTSKDIRKIVLSIYKDLSK